MNNRVRHREGKDDENATHQSPPNERYAELDEVPVDFASAGLYLGAIQVIFVVTLTSFVSLAACWLSPEGGVSAVRTLALCVGTSSLLLRAPLRIGRVRGVKLVFSALRWAAPVYVLALVVEQLVHTCATADEHVPSWRHGLFAGATLVMLMAGVLSARKPLDETDLPFLVTMISLLTVALIPPPAVALIGPLCQPVGLADAAIRLVRAFTFASLYAVHVYASTSPTAGLPVDMLVTVSKSSAAAIWTLTVHPLLLFAAIIQATIAIVSRVTNNNASANLKDHKSNVAYKRVPDRSTEDIERGESLVGSASSSAHAYMPESPTRSAVPNGSAIDALSDDESMIIKQSESGSGDESEGNQNEAEEAEPGEESRLMPLPHTLPFSLAPSLGPLRWHDLAANAASGTAAKAPMTQERLAQIAANMDDSNNDVENKS